MSTNKICAKIKHKQVSLLLEKFEKYIANFKITISEKDKQLYDLKNILTAANISSQQTTNVNIQLKQYIATIK